MIDEVAGGLSYYDHTFLRELPRLYGDLEDGLAASDPGWNNTELPSFIRMGSWIGGDRRVRIPWGDVARVESAIELKQGATELGLGRGDDRVRPYVDKIPGAGR